jgi:hypothetical protein
MMHPDSEVRYFGNRGNGVFATRRIAAGTLVWIPGETDQTLSVMQVSAMSERERKYLAEYSYLTNEGTYIVSKDIARFVNHSCNANALSIAGLEVSIVVRDIEQGEEITEDYGLYYANGGFASCSCASSGCRHQVTKDDIWQYGAEWDRKIFASLKLLPAVEQPLWPFISVAVRQQIEAILANKQEFPSCQTLRCSADFLDKAAELLWPSAEGSQRVVAKLQR